AHVRDGARVGPGEDLPATGTDYERNDMCGIVGFWDKTGRTSAPIGRVVLTMLEALACRGPDSAGLAVIAHEHDPSRDGAWSLRIACGDPGALVGLESLGRLKLESRSPAGGSEGTLRVTLQPAPGVTADDVERALGARRGGTEILSLGGRLDLV